MSDSRFVENKGIDEKDFHSIYSHRIQAGAITSDKINKNAVTELKISDGAVSKNKLAKNSVTPDKVDMNHVYDMKGIRNTLDDLSLHGKNSISLRGKSLNIDVSNSVSVSSVMKCNNSILSQSIILKSSLYLGGGDKNITPEEILSGITYIGGASGGGSYVVFPGTSNVINLLSYKGIKSKQGFRFPEILISNTSATDNITIQAGTGETILGTDIILPETNAKIIYLLVDDNDSRIIVL